MFRKFLSVTFILTTFSPKLSSASQGSALLFESRDERAPNGRSTMHHFKAYDVTKIEIYNTLTGRRLANTLTDDEHEALITVLFTAFNRTFNLILRRSRLMFSSSYIEKYITKNGEHRRQVKTSDDQCYYTGSVQHQEQETTAAVSTCNGMTGYVATLQEIYYIEPESNDIQGQHLVFRESDNTVLQKRLGVGTTYSQHVKQLKKRKMKRSFNWPQDLDGTTRVVELYIVNSHSQYVALQSDVNQVVARTKNIVNVVNSLYNPVDIYFVLVGIEVWIDAEHITINYDDSGQTLINFMLYRKNSINPKHHNDNAQLITNKIFEGSIVGKAVVGKMCAYLSSGGINSDISVPAYVGTSMSHEIGHNFNLLHDDNIPNCQCADPSGYCIMYPSENPAYIPTHWSSCSKSTLRESLSTGLDYCLKNIPTALYSTSSVCGNGIIEDGEKCDCGSNPISQECNAACCDSTTCQLVGSAQCSAGRCCDVAKCQLRSQGFECRPAVGTCDLSEYCDGQQPVCPSDVYKRDSTSCNTSGVDAYCYQGQCRSPDSQCKFLWGNASSSSNQQCYSYFNVRGNNGGNCGLIFSDSTNLNYTACSASDAMCGQLLCSATDSMVNFRSLALYTTAGKLTSNSYTYICNAVAIDAGIDLQSPGMVPNGAKCDNNKMCLNQRCVDISTLNIASCSNNCNGNGVCNSLGQCHCNVGYSPSTDCSLAGCGGSVHSGSPTSGCFDQTTSATSTQHQLSSVQTPSSSATVSTAIASSATTPRTNISTEINLDTLTSDQVTSSVFESITTRIPLSAGNSVYDANPSLVVFCFMAGLSALYNLNAR